uniref:R-spondin 4 n=1 Tax=Fundulus heteroclitus TaxID=8078 RepID=A0A3Q2QGS0_FUNHE
MCFLLAPAAHRETSEDCQSCLECSRDNGCVRCPERLFLFLQRKGMSHHGTCLHSCPAGHFGQRGRDVNRCMKCRSLDCEHCFSRDFCTKCKPGFKLHKGKCLIHCPEGTYAHQTDCLEWSEWSVCVRDGGTCGFRWGKQTRARQSSQSGRVAEEKGASVCLAQSETQRCRMKKKCPTGETETAHRKMKLLLDINRSQHPGAKILIFWSEKWTKSPEKVVEERPIRFIPVTQFKRQFQEMPKGMYKKVENKKKYDLVWHLGIKYVIILLFYLV